MNRINTHHIGAPEDIDKKTFLLELISKFQCEPYTEIQKQMIEIELERYENIFGQKLRVIKTDRQSIMITNARPRLFFLGLELDNNKETELISEKGYTVKLSYTKESEWFPKEQILNNITEIYYMFDSLIDKEQVAFESNIDSTGFTRLLEDLELIEIL